MPSPSNNPLLLLLQLLGLLAHTNSILLDDPAVPCCMPAGARGGQRQAKHECGISSRPCAVEAQASLWPNQAGH